MGIDSGSYYMVAISLFHSHVLEAVLTDPQFWHFSIFFRVRAEVPSVYLIFSHLDFVNVLDFGYGFVLLL